DNSGTFFIITQAVRSQFGGHWFNIGWTYGEIEYRNSLFTPFVFKRLNLFPDFLIGSIIKYVGNQIMDLIFESVPVLIFGFTPAGKTIQSFAEIRPEFAVGIFSSSQSDNSKLF